MKLFKLEDKINKFLVYHDESGTISLDRWFVTGLLFIDLEKEELLKKELNKIKDKYNIKDIEIHFSDLPKSYNGEYGKKGLVARDWLELFINNNQFFNIYFNVMALDKKSPAYDTKRFPKDFLAYNRFTVMALKSAINWFFKDYLYLYFEVFSDDKSRNKRFIEDNFTKYVPNKLEKELFNYKSNEFKNIIIKPEIVLKSSKEDIFLQFCDILLGAISQAIEVKSKRLVKLDLAEKISYCLLDLRKKRERQELNLFRRLNLWYFPNKYGYPYTEGPLEITKIIENNNPQLF